jgi:hypothetical protein
MNFKRPRYEVTPKLPADIIGEEVIIGRFIFQAAEKAKYSEPSRQTKAAAIIEQLYPLSKGNFDMRLMKPDEELKAQDPAEERQVLFTNGVKTINIGLDPTRS